jgi:polar amino acid transport system permease protein/polar amino acid transport system substrate-binding protein
MTYRMWVALVAVALGAARSAAAADALAALHARGTLRWGGDIQGGEPYAFQDAEDSTKLRGFEVEIAAGLARRLGVRAEFVQNDWLTLIPSLERGDFDIILNGLEVTAARRARVAFTRPYYAFSETLVARRADASVHNLADLNGRRVGTLGGSLAFDLLRNTPGVDVVVYEGVEEPYIDLEHGRVAAVLLDNIIANRYGLVRPSLQAVATVSDGIYAIAIRRDQPALLGAVDHALEAMIRDGELRAILERWNLWNDRQTVLVSNPVAVAPLASPGVSLSQAFMFVRATGFTVMISTLAMAVAVAGGLLLSLARRYGGRPLRVAVSTYIEVFRGTPVLLQLYVLYYGLASVLPLNAFAAAVAGLGLNYAAYEAELYRAGLEAVPIGQTEAALSLGMSRGLALRRIVLPQALRVALPGIANDFIALLKDSSLVSVITVVELTKQMTITAVDVRSWFLPGLLCAALYLALSYPLSRLARRLERRLTPVQA